MTPEAAREKLAALGRLPDAQFDAIEAALTLAEADDPASPIVPARAAWQALSQAADAALERHPLARAGIAEAQGRFLAGLLRDQGFSGDKDTYDAPENANLAHVLVRRKGLPVALGLLWIGLARRQGWAIAGIDMPLRFLVRLTDDQDAMMFDPFDAGRIVDFVARRRLSEELTGHKDALTAQDQRPATDRQVVLRLANNLRVRRIDDDALEAAFAITEDMRLLAPLVPILMITAGELALHIGRPGAAVAHLSAYLATEPPCDRARAAQALLDKARKSLN